MATPSHNTNTEPHKAPLEPTPAPRLALDACVALEHAVWEALVAGDKDADRSLLSEDFLGVYPTGFANRADHVGQLADGPTMADYRIEQPQLREIAAGQVLLSYLANYSPIVGGVTGPRAAMFISSLWSWDGTEWINTFSQDTPASST